MALELNTKEEYIKIDGNEIPFFREFYGRNLEQASEIKEAGRVPAPAYNILDRKANSHMEDWSTN